jgi:hypothetical protein
MTKSPVEDPIVTVFIKRLKGKIDFGRDIRSGVSLLEDPRQKLIYFRGRFSLFFWISWDSFATCAPLDPNKWGLISSTASLHL